MRDQRREPQSIKVTMLRRSLRGDDAPVSISRRVLRLLAGRKVRPAA